MSNSNDKKRLSKRQTELIYRVIIGDTSVMFERDYFRIVKKDLKIKVPKKIILRKIEHYKKIVLSSR